MFNYKKLFFLKLTFILIFLSNVVSADDHNLNEVLELIQKDLKTLEKAVYSGSIAVYSSNSQKGFDENSEDVLTRHLLKLSEVEAQFRELTNKFEEINFKIDKLSSRLSKVQADNQLRFQDIENSLSTGEASKKLTLKPKDQLKKKLPGSSQPQDLGSISYKDSETNETTQKIQSVETTSSIVTETFRIRQLYTDAATAYLEGYQKYPKGEKAPINLLKLGVSMVQIGEKDQGCKMINGVEKQYPKANQSVIQKAKYESKKFECIKQDS